MELNQLHCFKIVAQTENISRAAEKLHISQPSLSQTVKRLEEELGYQLFEREGRKIRLNDSGKMLLHTVDSIEQLLEDALLEMAERNGRAHPEVSIYIGCASMLLPELLHFLRQRNPGVQYRIHQWNTESGDQEKDIKILAEPEEQKDESRELLMEERIILALPVGHPLLAKEEISMRDLAGEEFISLNRNWALARSIWQEMERIKFEPKVTILVDNPNLMRELLHDQMGIAFVPAATWNFFSNREMVMRSVEEFDTTRKIYLSHPAKRYLTREQRECIAGIREFFRKKAAGFAEECL